MRAAILFLILIFGASEVWTQEYNLVWEDNFEGEGLNPAIWNIEQKKGSGTLDKIKNSSIIKQRM